MKKRIQLYLVVAALAVFGMFGCNKSGVDSKIVGQAQDLMVEMKKARTGEDAIEKSKEIEGLRPAAISKAVWLKMISAADLNEEQRIIKEAWARETVDGIRDLKILKANPSKALELKKKILNAQAHSGRDLSSFKISEAKIDRIVEVNLNKSGVNTVGTAHLNKKQVARAATNKSKTQTGRQQKLQQQQQQKQAKT